MVVGKHCSFIFSDHRSQIGLLPRLCYVGEHCGCKMGGLLEFPGSQGVNPVYDYLYKQWFRCGIVVHI